MNRGRIVIKKVDIGKEAIAHCLMYLQTTILPSDTPRPLKGDEWWIAYQNGSPVGFASYRMIDKTTAYLSRSGVLYAARGQGIQKRMIRVRVKHAINSGATLILSDTTDNVPSSNSLIAEGFRLYDPVRRWAYEHSNYWRKEL